MAVAAISMTKVVVQIMTLSLELPRHEAEADGGKKSGRVPGFAGWERPEGGCSSSAPRRMGGVAIMRLPVTGGKSTQHRVSPGARPGGIAVADDEVGVSAGVAAAA